MNNGKNKIVFQFSTLLLYLAQKIFSMKYVLACFFIVFLFGCQDSKSKKNTPQLEQIKKEKSDFVDLNGLSVELASFKGKKILMNYWATWCAPCKKEMPDLLRAQEILTENNYVFLLVSDETIEQISEFKNKTNYNFRFLKSNNPIEKLGIYALPTTFIYDENGKKVKEIIGAVVWDSEEMINTLKNI